MLNLYSGAFLLRFGKEMAQGMGVGNGLQPYERVGALQNSTSWMGVSILSPGSMPKRSFIHAFIQYLLNLYYMYNISIVSSVKSTEIIDSGEICNVCSILELLTTRETWTIGILAFSLVFWLKRYVQPRRGTSITIETVDWREWGEDNR